MANYKVSGITLTFDNARLQPTQSQEDETIPAVGESDTGTYFVETVQGSADKVSMSADSGSNYKGTYLEATNQLGDVVGNVQFISGIGNSTGRYKLVMDATAGTRVIHQMLTTKS